MVKCLKHKDSGGQICEIQGQWWSNVRNTRIVVVKGLNHMDSGGQRSETQGQWWSNV